MAATAHKPGTPAEAHAFLWRVAGAAFPDPLANPPTCRRMLGVLGEAQDGPACRENYLILMVF